MKAGLGIFILGFAKLFHTVAMLAAGIYSFSGFYFMFAEGFMAGVYVFGKALIAVVAIEIISVVLIAIGSALRKNVTDSN